MSLGDTILIKQYDQKENVQISKGANTYLITPDGAHCRRRGGRRGERGRAATSRAS
jgi:hypothetical protein